MAKTPISEEEVTEIAAAVKERFLSQHSESEKFDPRDLQRVKNDLEFVAKFIRQQRGNRDNAINQMVESLKWRHQFGVNDIHYEDIEDHYWRSGMAYNHGMDKNGNHIVILNIRLHRKDSKKSLALQRWITFCFETQCRVYPKGRMCMIFDMNGCGLSQMDMELMRFIVNCFKIYFPDMLAILLVFNMPWILQAAWKIVQSWLSEGAVAKVKFVNSETILEYVSTDQLLVNFGGTDEWQFDYETEKAVMLNLLQGIQGRGEGEGEEEDSPSHSSDAQFSDAEQSPSGFSVESNSLADGKGTEEQRNGERRESGEQKIEDDGPEEGRKVRFSSNLPPTRQSRFGPEDEEERQRMVSPENQQLLRGSAASQGFRRRQIHRLMSLQTDTRDQRSPGKTAGRRSSDPLTPFTHIILSPVNELVFNGGRDKELLCTLTLSNTSQNAAAFKIKTTAPRRYKVRPNLALIQPKSMTKVQVLLVPNLSYSAVSEDKFLVQIYSFPASVSAPSQRQLPSFWRSLSEKDIMEHRMRCRLVREDNSTLLPQTATPTASSTTHTPSLPTSPPFTPSHTDTHSQKELCLIGEKLDRMVKANQQLSGSVRRLQHWVIVLVVLIVALLLKTLFL